MNFKNENFDVIIVGTGPGGATVAKELSKTGKKVLMIERGKMKHITGSFRDYALEQLWPGKSLLFTSGMLGMVRGLTTGGSSVYNYATCFPVPVDMLKKYGIDITDALQDAYAELPVGPIKEEMVTPMAKRIMESAQCIGYNWSKLDKFMFVDKWKPGMRFGYYGDPHGVKWTARNYVEEALVNGAKIINQARANRIIFSGRKAVAVEFKCKGGTITAEAPVFVLAAGGIGTPVILRKSGMKSVGNDFFFDPLISVCGYIEDIIKQQDEIPMTAGCHLAEEGYMMTDMALPPALENIFAAEVFRFHRMFESDHTIRIMIKARDCLGGTISGNGGVKKKLSRDDRQKLNDGYLKAKEILIKAGAKDIYRTWYLAAHPGGTVKIGSCLDSNMKTEFDNLYVCDCSVIPEPWGLPPVMTLIVLGKYLAKHLGCK